jgi:protoporphyrin/coproporphyrin ferrochelatase
MKTTGILLVNLGTPNSPKGKDVYQYLIEFLTDKRVIDSGWLARQLLVRSVIVPFRYRQSAKAYRSIWTQEGSPLKVYGYRVQEKLQERLGKEFVVELAMRYQHPSISEALERLQSKSINRLIVIPLFPQYASATTGSVHQKVMEILSQWDVIPELVFIDQYATHPDMIEAFCEVASPYRCANYDHVLLSFHGLPEKQLVKADKKAHCLRTQDCCQKLSKTNATCYSAQCYATAQALAKALKLEKSHYTLSFQSRLGKDPWLQPYTSEVIRDLARKGKKRILVFCPSFVCDCLETVYEIGVEYAEEFKHAGGEQLDLVPGLNDHPRWIDALSVMSKAHIQ